MRPRGEEKDVDSDEQTAQEPEDVGDRRPEVEGHRAELPGDGANHRKEEGLPPTTDSPPDDQRRFWPLLEDWDSMSADVRFALLVAGVALGGATCLLLACAVCYYRSPERRFCPVCRDAESAAAAAELGVLQPWTPS
ncbi:uncharacterized protein LOC134533553 isoform X2 [Bacillus rossius redtenbacheri]